MSTLQDELADVLGLADGVILLVEDRSKIEKLVEARQQLQLERKRVARHIREAEERNRKLLLRRESLLAVERKAAKCGLPEEDCSTLTGQEVTRYLSREKEQAEKKISSFKERIQELEKGNLQEQQLKYLHDLQRTIAPLQFDENQAEHQIRGFVKATGGGGGGGEGNIRTFNFDSKTMSRGSISDQLWAMV